MPISIPAPSPHRLLAPAFLITPGLAVVSDPSPVPLLLITMVAAAPGALLSGWRPQLPKIGALALPILALAWAGITLIWTPAPLASAETLVRVVALVVAGWLLADLAADTLHRHASARVPIGRAVIGGLVIATAVLAVELVFDHPLVRTFEWNWAPGGVRDHDTNRGASLILILVWIALPVAIADGRRRIAVPLAVTALAATLFLTESAASQLAAVGGAATLALGLASAWLRRCAWVLMIAVGVLSMPWLAQVAFDAGVHEADELPRTAQQRIYIWYYTSEWALDRPLTGWGFDSSEHIGNRGVEPAEGKSNVIPLHPHNNQLQVWLELGVWGAVLAALWLSQIARHIERAPSPQPSWLTATVTTAFIIAGIGYGAWQTHWIASLLWVWVYARAGLAITTHDRSPV